MRARDMTNRAIADALGIKLSTVKTLVRRARQRLGLTFGQKLENAFSEDVE